MIKFYLDGKKGNCQLEVHGNMSEICADSIVMIYKIYKALEEDGDGTHDVYKKAIKEAVENDVAFNGSEKEKEEKEKEGEEKSGDDEDDGFSMDDLDEFIGKGEELLKKLRMVAEK